MAPVVIWPDCGLQQAVTCFCSSYLNRRRLFEYRKRYPCVSCDNALRFPELGKTFVRSFVRSFVVLVCCLLTDLCDAPGLYAECVRYGSQQSVGSSNCFLVLFSLYVKGGHKCLTLSPLFMASFIM